MLEKIRKIMIIVMLVWVLMWVSVVLKVCLVILVKCVWVGFLWVKVCIVCVDNSDFDVVFEFWVI